MAKFMIESFGRDIENGKWMIYLPTFIRIH